MLALPWSRKVYQIQSTEMNTERVIAEFAETMKTEESCEGPNPEHLEADNVPRTWGNPIKIPRCAEDTNEILASTPERTFLDPETTAMVWNVANTMAKKDRHGYDGRVHPEELLFVLHATTVMEGDDRDKLVALYEDQLIWDEHWRLYDALLMFHKTVRDYEVEKWHRESGFLQEEFQRLRELVFQLVDALKTITLLAPNVLTLGRLPDQLSRSGREVEDADEAFGFANHLFTRLAIFADEEVHVKDGSRQGTFYKASIHGAKWLFDDMAHTRSERLQRLSAKITGQSYDGAIDLVAKFCGMAKPGVGMLAKRPMCSNFVTITDSKAFRSMRFFDRARLTMRDGYKAVDHLRTLSSRWQAMKYAYCQTRWPTSYITTVGQPTYTLNERLLRYMELSNWPPGFFDLGFHRQLRVFFNITLSPTEIQKMDLALLAKNYESYCEPAEQYKRGYGAIALALCGGQLNLTYDSLSGLKWLLDPLARCSQVYHCFPKYTARQMQQGLLGNFYAGLLGDNAEFGTVEQFRRGKLFDGESILFAAAHSNSIFNLQDMGSSIDRRVLCFDAFRAVDQQSCNEFISAMNHKGLLYEECVHVVMLILSHVESQNNALGITAPEVFPHGRPLVPWIYFPPIDASAKSFDSREGSTIFYDITPVGAGDPQMVSEPQYMIQTGNYEGFANIMNRVYHLGNLQDEHVVFCETKSATEFTQESPFLHTPSVLIAESATFFATDFKFLSCSRELCLTVTGAVEDLCPWSWFYLVAAKERVLSSTWQYQAATKQTFEEYTRQSLRDLCFQNSPSQWSGWRRMTRALFYDICDMCGPVQDRLLQENGNSYQGIGLRLLDADSQQRLQDEVSVRGQLPEWTPRFAADVELIAKRLQALLLGGSVVRHDGIQAFRLYLMCFFDRFVWESGLWLIIELMTIGADISDDAKETFWVGGFDKYHSKAWYCMSAPWFREDGWMAKCHSAVGETYCEVPQGFKLPKTVLAHLYQGDRKHLTGTWKPQMLDKMGPMSTLSPEMADYFLSNAPIEGIRFSLHNLEGIDQTPTCPFEANSAHLVASALSWKHQPDRRDETINIIEGRLQQRKAAEELAEALKHGFVKAATSELNELLKEEEQKEAKKEAKRHEELQRKKANKKVNAANKKREEAEEKLRKAAEAEATRLATKRREANAALKSAYEKVQGLLRGHEEPTKEGVTALEEARSRLENAAKHYATSNDEARIQQVRGLKELQLKLSKMTKRHERVNVLERGVLRACFRALDEARPLPPPLPPPRPPTPPSSDGLTSSPPSGAGAGAATPKGKGKAKKEPVALDSLSSLLPDIVDGPLAGLDAPPKSKRSRKKATSPGAGSSAAHAVETAAPSLAEDKECVVCQDALKTHLFTNCGHKCVCRSCADDLRAQKKACPMCRTRGKIIEVFE